MRKFLFILFVLLTIVSGCIGQPKETKIINTDLLKINNIDIFPSTQLESGDTIVIRMELENIGQTDVKLRIDKDKTEKDIEGDLLLIDYCNTMYKLEADGFKLIPERTIYSSTDIFKDDKTVECPNTYCYNGEKYTGRCDPTYGEGEPCTPPIKNKNLKYCNCIEVGLGSTTCYFNMFNGECQEDTSTSDFFKDASYIVLNPGDIQYVQWELKAPTEDKLMGLSSECNFKFQAAYVTKAQTNTYIYFASPTEITQRIYTADDLSLSGDNIATYGPIVINVEPLGTQPLSGGPEETFTIRLNLKNMGSGIAQLEGSKLLLELPEEITPTKDCPFEGDPLTLTEDRKSELKIYKDKTSTFSCKLNAPSVNILKPYKFQSTAIYGYILSEERRIVTRPESI